MRRPSRTLPTDSLRTWSALLLALTVCVQAIWIPSHIFAEHHHEPTLLAIEHEAFGVEDHAHHLRGVAGRHDHDHDRSQGHGTHHQHDENAHGPHPALDHLFKTHRGNSDDTWSPAPLIASRLHGFLALSPRGTLRTEPPQHPPRSPVPPASGPRAPPLA